MLWPFRISERSHLVQDLGTTKVQKLVGNFALDVRWDPLRIADLQDSFIWLQLPEFFTISVSYVDMGHCPRPRKLSSPDFAPKDHVFKIQNGGHETKHILDFMGGLLECCPDSTPNSHNEYQKRNSTQWGEFLFHTATSISNTSHISSAEFKSLTALFERRPVLK